MSLGGLVAGLTGLVVGWGSGPHGLDVRPWMERAGVRAVAVHMAPERCADCRAAEAGFERMHARYAERGVAFLVVAEASGEACPRPAWADHVLCGAGKVFTAYRAPKDRATGLLWSWRGPLLARGAPARLRQALAGTKVSVAIQAHGRDAKALGAALARAAQASGKLTPKVERAGTMRSVRGCDPGHRATGRLLITARTRGGKLEAALEDPSWGCRIAEAHVSLAARDLAHVAAEAVGRLVYPLVGDPEVPSLGAPQGASERRPPIAARPAPGVLIAPGEAPVETPIDAVEPLAPIEAPDTSRARPGRLVDPSRPRRTRAVGGGNLQDVAASWVGTRYVLDGDGRGGIDDKNLTREVFRTVYGIDLTNNLLRQLRSGPEVPLDPAHPDRSLRPGDLLFFVSYGYQPRSVMVYLGGGKMLSSQVIRGVVIDDAPKSVPHYLYLVARRPLAGGG